MRNRIGPVFVVMLLCVSGLTFGATKADSKVNHEVMASGDLRLRESPTSGFFIISRGKEVGLIKEGEYLKVVREETRNPLFGPVEKWLEVERMNPSPSEKKRGWVYDGIIQKDGKPYLEIVQ